MLREIVLDTETTGLDARRGDRLIELGCIELISRSPIAMDRVIDTLALARRKHPGGPNSLDALCKRYGIDNSKRTKHGALTDSALLAEVYVELLGERQATLVLSKEDQPTSRTETRARSAAALRPDPLPARLTA